MANRNDASHQQAVPLLTAAVSANGATGYLDVRGADSVGVLVTAGTTGADASNTLTVKLQHADATPGAAGSYTDVPASQQAGGPFVVDDDDVSGVIAYTGNKPYLRVVYTEAGTISGPVAIVALLGRLAQAPEPSVAPITGAVS